MSESETNPEFKFQKLELSFLLSVICILDIRACFELRISCFEFSQLF